MTYEQIIDMWKNGLSEGSAWKNFVKFCNKYNIDRSYKDYYVEPIPCGFNIINFDMVIAKRLAEKYDTKFPMSPVNKVDAMDMLFTWFENLEQPDKIKMDVLRPFLGIQSNGHAHEGIVDVLDEAKIITKFLKFQRRQASVKKFKGAFANG
jgi:hypothetical protein